jgi:protein ImuA
MKTPRDEVLQTLKLRLQQISGTKSNACSSDEVLSTGITALDDLLPQRGLPKGSMVEWLIADAGVGAATLALAGVRAALEKASGGTGCWVVIDLQRQFFPPAALGWGISLERLLLVQPASERDAAWAFEQALRCPGVAVTWNWIDSVTERMLQRWKVAVEAGGGQGVLFRSERALKQAAWADVRWLVQPLPTPSAPKQTDSTHAVSKQIASNHSPPNRSPLNHNPPNYNPPNYGAASSSEAGRRLRLKLVYCRGTLGGDQVEVECNDETGHVCLVTQLADSTPRITAVRA